MNMKLLVETMCLVKIFVTTVCVLFLMTKRDGKDAPDHSEGSNQQLNFLMQGKKQGPSNS